ncbi:MAG: L,D-transpeptidase family protein [Beijerinckiaceae bacterium]
MLSTRSSLLAAALVSVLGLSACNDHGSLPRSGRHYVPISMATQEAMREKGMRTHAPILIRAYKQESEIEVWKQTSGGKLELLKTFPTCRWSGQLGPKVREGDRQVPEGFYTVTPGAMNPNSNFYLSFNVGYPNTFDRQLGRTGNLIMVHGDCSSMGCFAMTDNQMADIYGLTREAFAGGQKQIQFQSYPFRMTTENLAKYRNDPHMPFWKNLKQGNDHFEVTRSEVKVAACNGRYNFGGESCDTGADEEVRTAVAAKQRNDEIKVAALVSEGTRAVKRVYRDGDMHPAFKGNTAIATAGGLSGQSVGTTRNGVSRLDSLAFTPVEIPVDQYKAHRAKGRTPLQIAELVNQEKINAEANPPKAEPAKAVPAKVMIARGEPAKVEPGKAEPARTTTASTAAAPAAASAVALAPAAVEAPDRSVFQRMMGSVGLGSQETAKTDEAKLEEITPHRVTVPLPPRRQAAANAPTAGPQASLPAAKVPDIISDTQRLAPSSLSSGFIKAQ